MTERNVMNENHVKLSREGFRLFRNNVGKGWTGESIYYCEWQEKITVNIGDVIIRAARRIHYGLLKGSGDLIGYKTVKITEDMVGKEIAVFASVEQKVKRRKRTKEQTDWDAQVQRAGGISILLNE